MTAPAVTAATLPVVRSLIDEAKRKRFTGGVLGVLARPEWDGPDEFQHDGIDVRVVRCPSALAVREALLERDPSRWLVVITDRDGEDLGLGITAHLIWQRLRHPDPWAAVQDSFNATRIDHRLVETTNGRDLATGLLAAAPADGWPPARAGLLTSDHAFGAVATSRLGLGGIGEELDLTAILRWSTLSNASSAVADLRAIAGDILVEALIAWLAGRCGACGGATAPLLREGRAGDLVPLGLVARAVVATAPSSGPRALLGRELRGHLSDEVLAAWASEAELVTRDLLRADPDSAARVLARAESVVGRLEVEAFADRSAVLRIGLTSRLAALGDALRRCADRAPGRASVEGPEVPLVDSNVLAEVESHLSQVVAHALAGRPDELRVPRALGGVRLARWLALPVAEARDLSEHIGRHRDEDAWADRAASDAWTGVEDEALAQGLRAVLAAARSRRNAHDVAFARALGAHHERGGVAPAGSPYIENLLAATVLPLAKRQPVLLVVADGMSQGVATEVVDDVVRRYETWLEALPVGSERRVTAIAALPSLTSVSRTSLFVGELTVGDQKAERDGFEALARSYGVSGKLFHKLSLDSSEAGYALAHDVGAAIDDVSSSRVVACVLNTIDDALDRSDPGGIEWTADTVKHLRPLLERARRAGRVVVLTSDHGHIVERRAGRTAPARDYSSNRSRPYAVGSPPVEGEVRVRGRRVLLHDGDAVLAVDERLRYGPLKAGYHGGAAPAEVVIPVAVLALGEAPEGWRHAPPQSPAWWRGPLSEPTVQLVTPPSALPSTVAVRNARPDEVPTLFDDVEAAARPAGLVAEVLASATYREQRSRATRAAVTDAQVGALLTALLSVSGNRLDPESAAAALGVATVQLEGALSQARRLLNVEQYPVLDRDADGSTIVLDVDLLREQFGVSV